MKRALAFGAALLALAMPLIASAQRIDRDGQLMDAMSGAAIADGIITIADHETRINSRGRFHIRGAPGRIAARAPGYRRANVSAGDFERAGGVIRLEPFQPRALYLTSYGVGSAKLMGGALSIIAAGGANALVIDIKGDRGIVNYPSAVPLTATPGVRRVTTIPDLTALVDRLHGAGIYVIVRIVTFKDDPLARAHPDWAVRRGKGLFIDREHLAWTDPFRSEVRRYNIDIAVEAAKAGVDEVQFDYLRFPDSSAKLSFAQPATQQSRIAAIAAFLAEARQALAAYNVFIAADIFGYVCWNTDDTGIGQRLEDLVPQVDYLSPMLYPSGYRWGIPGTLDPVKDPYAIVGESLAEAQRRLGIAPKRFRPWLQAFRDYAFDRRAFGTQQVGDQIRASEDFGADGWMLWNAGNDYSDTGLTMPRKGS